MAETFYRLRILGILPGGADREAVVNSVALLFKTTPEQVDVLLRQPTLLQKLFSRKAVDRLQGTLLHIGVECEVEAAMPEVPATPLPLAAAPATPPAPFAHTAPAQAEASTLAASGKPVVPLAMDPLTMLHPVVELAAEPDERDWRAFIGANADYYLLKHQQMRAAHHQAMSVRLRAYWHWPAFLWAPLWFWYRKMYGLALFSLLTLPLLGAANVLWGSLANWLYYQHGRDQIREMRSYFPHDELDDTLAEAGGVLSWQTALPQAVGLSLVLFVLLWWVLPVVNPLAEPPVVIAERPAPPPVILVPISSTNNKPPYVHQPLLLNNRQAPQYYADVRGLDAQTQQQAQTKAVQTSAGQTAQRMGQIRSQLNGFLRESLDSPIPQSSNAAQQATGSTWPADGWGKPWDYKPLEYGYRLTSAGPDKQFSTDDDIWLESQPRMPIFMQREQAAAEAAVAQAAEQDVQPLQVSPDE